MNSKPSLTAPVHSVWILALVAILGVVGCGREGRDLSLLEAPAAAKPTPAEEDEAERRRLEEMQLVQVQDSDTGEFFSMEVEEVHSSLLGGGPPASWFGGGPCSFDIVCPSSSTSASNCGEWACWTRAHMCVARYLQSMALIRAEPVTLNLGDLNVSVLAQSAPAKAALLRFARGIVENQILDITSFGACDDALDHPETPISGEPTTSFGPAAGAYFADTVAETVRLSEELTFDTVDAVVAAGDAQRSQTLEVKKGAARAVAGAEVSRAEAAHLLIGGDPGLMGSTSKAFCGSPELSGRARRALAFIRRAAPSPQQVMSTTAVPTDMFLNGTLTAFSSGSIAVRLAYLDGLCTGNPATCPVTPIQQQTGISTEDFVQARSYLIEEIGAFARSTSSSAIFTPTKIGSAVLPTSVFFYASTRNEPTPPPPEYYAALSRYLQPGWTPPDPAWPGLNFESRFDLAQTLHLASTNIRGNSTALINLTKAQTTSPFPDQYKLIDGTISALLADDPRRGVLERTRTTSGGSTLFRAYGFASTDGLRIVRGMDGLICATRGNIEGTPCTDLTPHLAGDLTTAGPAAFRFGNSAQATITVTDSATPLFVVRPRSTAELVPGGYDYLLGFVVMNTTTNTTYAHPMVPDLDRKAGELLRPSQRFCTRSAVECDGTLFDERLPLENELSDDGDGVESSWKHYLALAEQAANEAHALGEQYITNGMEVDRSVEASQLRDIVDQQRFVSKAEAELETVQNICGTAMSTDELLGVLNVSLSGFSANRSTCTTNDNCCAPAAAPCAHSTCISNVCQPVLCSNDTQCCNGTGNYCEFKCVSSRCARTVEGILSTPTSGEGVSRITECVGNGSVAPFAIMGTDPVCIWSQTGNSNGVCYGSSELYPCPATPRVDATGQLTCSGVPFPSGANAPVLFPANNAPLDLTLKLVASGKGVLPFDTCVDLRKRRDNVGSQFEICGRLANGGTFIGSYAADDDKVVDSLAAEYTFTNEAFGARVNINQDRNIRWSTGGRAGATKWPCADHPFATPAECALTPRALFCQKVNCNATTVPAELAKLAAINQRLVEATVLLKGLVSADFEKVIVPAQLGAQLEPYSPLQVPAQGLYSTAFSNYRLTAYPGQNPTPQWRSGSYGSPLNFNAYTVIGTPSPLPVFYRFYVPPSTTPTTYPISNPATSGAYQALVPLPNYPTRTSSYVGQLLVSRTTCGESADWGYGSVGPWMFDPSVPTPTSLVPLGDGVLSNAQTLNARQAPDRPYLTTRFRYDDQGVADAAELLCEAERGVLTTTQPGTGCGNLNPGSINVAGDFNQVVAYANCKVADFERSIGGLALPRVPVRIIQGIHDASQGNFPSIGGEMGAQMHRLRAALIRFGELNVSMRDAAAELRDVVQEMATSMAQLDIQIQQEQIDIANGTARSSQARLRIAQVDVQMQAAEAKEALDCAGGLVNGLSGAATSFGTSMLSGASDCVKASISAQLEVQSLGYEKQIAQIEQQIANNTADREEFDLQYVQLEHARDLIRQRGLVRSIGGRMAELRTEAQASIEEISASLADLETLRLRVLRSLSRATQYQSTAAAVTQNIDSVLNAKLDVSKRRYEQAHQNAIRLTFLAKRAIEQRLGVHLSEIRADLPLVKAPATWESTICTAEGVNYDALRKPDGTAESKNFAGAYIGDYVRNLRNLVESYRLEHDFQEGTDEVVASVRDDVFGTRQLCAKSLGNRLTYSGTLNYVTADPAQPGWLMQGCTIGVNGVDSTCLDISFDTNSPLNPVTASETNLNPPDGGSAPGYKLTWGTAANLSERLAQQVRLTNGRYRVSWFTKEVVSPAGVQIDAGLFTLANVAVPAAQSSSVSRWSVPALNGWTRQYRIFDITTNDTYWLKLIPSQLVSRVGSVAGVMLEPLSGTDALEDPAKMRAPAYVATQADTNRLIKACADSDGSAFRGQSWTRRCERLCRDGFSGSCEESDRTRLCYWETTIGIDQRDIEEGRIFKQAGFATGNFNYRIENIAVNFVGTGVRDCANAENPSTCYAGGFVPYSLKHIGPYYVKNHAGDEFNVKLFTGNIEHARGLGMERYLTNPLSSTDRELIAPYVRTEFQGRPLDGSLALRVWEDPGIDFNAIADVQLYIKYRYWTRSQ